MNTTDAHHVIVLITVNDNETEAVLDAFLGEGNIPTQVPKGGLMYNDLGVHGGCQIMHTVSEMGAGGLGASQQRTRDAIVHWQPKATIAVGVAFGMDETKQAVGDVLISTQIQDYDLGRVGTDGRLTPRGDKPSSADNLRNRLRQIDIKERRRAVNWPKVRFGLILSGQKLVDNLDYRESLKSLYSEAIGGEMEGVGLYVSASATKTDWIVVKAICDWGYNKNNEDKDAWQKTAAKNSAWVLKAALDVAGLYGEVVLSTNVIDAELEATPADQDGNSDYNPVDSVVPVWQVGDDVKPSSDPCRAGARLLAVLADTPSLREAGLEVIESPEYPRIMALGDRLVPNPVWDAPAIGGPLDTRPICDRLRGHMFLVVAEPPGMNPHLYCYRSDRWNAYLFPFFKHEFQAPGSTSQHLTLDGHVVRRYSSRAVPTNKFVVSVKRNEEYPQEWWLYAFEFYSLVLPENFKFADNHRWLDLERLSDPHYREMSVNGDVIRAIRSYFGTGLHGLARSPVTPKGARFGDP